MEKQDREQPLMAAKTITQSSSKANETLRDNDKRIGFPALKSHQCMDEKNPRASKIRSGLVYSYLHSQIIWIINTMIW